MSQTTDAATAPIKNHIACCLMMPFSAPSGHGTPPAVTFILPSERFKHARYRRRLAGIRIVMEIEDDIVGVFRPGIGIAANRRSE